MAKALYLCPDTMALAARDGALVAGTALEQPPCLCEEPPPVGACCSPGGCIQTTEQECTSADGLSWTEGAECSEVECAPLGACCLVDGSCISITESGCIQANGLQWHQGEPCSAVECPVRPDCCESAGCFWVDVDDPIHGSAITWNVSATATLQVEVARCCGPWRQTAFSYEVAGQEQFTNGSMVPCSPGFEAVFEGPGHPWSIINPNGFTCASGSFFGQINVTPQTNGLRIHVTWTHDGGGFSPAAFLSPGCNQYEGSHPTKPVNWFQPQSTCQGQGSPIGGQMRVTITNIVVGVSGRAACTSLRPVFRTFKMNESGVVVPSRSIILPGQPCHTCGGGASDGLVGLTS